MRIIGSVKEDLSVEKRVSITPEIVKKYAEHLGINDEDYKKNGADISFSKEEILKKSEIILKVNCLSDIEANLIKSKIDEKTIITFSDLPFDDPKCRKPSLEKAKKILKWNPKINLSEGLNKTIKFYLDKSKK